MNKTLIRLISFILIIVMLIPGAFACKKETPKIDIQDIVVLFTANNNGAIADNIGYDGLTAYKYEAKNRTDNVTLVDLGNTLADTGNDSEKILKVLNAMNRVGYDIGVLGSNEFSLGLNTVSAFLKESDARYLGCNIKYNGSEENLLSNMKAYSMVQYGAVDVAYIGVVSPENYNTSDASAYIEGEKEVYDFSDSKNKFYETIQQTINECDELGAEYIVLLSSLSGKEERGSYTAVDLAQNISGADVILDREAASGSIEFEDKTGESILVAGCGNEFDGIGELVIGADGSISVNVISDYTKKDTAVSAYLQTTTEKEQQQMNKVVANSPYTMTLTDENGNNIIKTRENTVGNLCADAFRYACEADIAFVAGAEIGAGIDEGDITSAEFMATMPCGYKVTMVKATGQEILDALDMACKDLSINEITPDVEFDGFLHVSGLKYSIIGFYTTGIELDENGMYQGLGEGKLYRAENVMILQEDGNYLPIDLEKTYTVAASDYLLKQNGYGYTMFADNEVVEEGSVLDYQALSNYISKALGGEITDKYAETADRITIRRTAR